MKKYMVKDVKVDITEGGFACGPVPGYIVCEVELQSDDGSIMYQCLAEVDGTLNFYMSDESIFERQINEDFSDEFTQLMESSYTGGYDSYDAFYEELSNQLPLSNTCLVRKYLAYMVRADWADVDRMRENTVGKYIGEFEIPVCDAEAEYLAKCDKNTAQ